MSTKLLLITTFSIVFLCSCEFGTDRVYMEMYESMNANSTVIEDGIISKISVMKAAVKRKPDYKVLVPAAEEIEQVTKDFSSLVYSMNEHLDEKDLKAIKDDEIKSNIIAHRHKIIDAIKKLSDNRNFRITEEEIQELVDIHLFPGGNKPPINGKPFDDYLFENQSIACNKAILAKQKNDALMLARIAVNYLAGKIGHTWNGFHIGVVISAPKASFIIKGETFETEIFLSFPSRSEVFPVIIKIDGVKLPVKDGIAIYTVTPTTYGEHTYDVEIIVTNPFNSRQETYRRMFSFEVGERCY